MFQHVGQDDVVVPAQAELRSRSVELTNLTLSPNPSRCRLDRDIRCFDTGDVVEMRREPRVKSPLKLPSSSNLSFIEERLERSDHVRVNHIEIEAVRVLVDRRVSDLEVVVALLSSLSSVSRISS